MAIDYPAILERPSVRQVWQWDDRDAIVYALSLGFGVDPLDERHLPFVYEKSLKIVPSLPTVLAWVAQPTFSVLGVDPISALHGEQKIEMLRPVPIAADRPLRFSVEGRVLAVYDKGAARGAVVVTQHTLTDLADDQPFAVLTTSCFGRAEGGCGGSDDSGDQAPQPHLLPRRAPEFTVDYATPANLALLYRLTGDRNPLHAEPAVARAAGFERPILHGLCSFGLCCRAVLETYADFEPARIASQQARFSSPVYPGETLSIDLWRDDAVLSFQARVAAREVIVIRNGRCELR